MIDNKFKEWEMVVKEFIKDPDNFHLSIRDANEKKSQIQIELRCKKKDDEAMISTNERFAEISVSPHPEEDNQIIRQEPINIYVPMTPSSSSVRVEEITSQINGKQEADYDKKIEELLNESQGKDDKNEDKIDKLIMMMTELITLFKEHLQ
uniref:Uncharacterized protein n=1 Tax=Spongospora subterranea TaxID=70186 RepID=A0A0H5QJI7_9EUKA|eukprot:CRZ01481.1 hypothetical protein [Spongospora subterranea]